MAKAAGVSKSTVSLVVNNDCRVAADTVLAVRDVIERLDYQPKPVRNRQGPRVRKRKPVRHQHVMTRYNPMKQGIFWSVTTAMLVVQQAVVLAQTARYDFSKVTGQVQQWVDKGYYPGAALRVVKGDKAIYDRCFGGYTPETVVYIASAGKWLAAATVASVVDDGKLSWDDPVAKWLPEFTDVKGKATLRQLMSHTSGYPPYQPKGNRPDDYQTLAESVQHIVPLPAACGPGERFEYGGLGMQVAGRMAEVAAGEEFERLFEQRIANPLGMKNTHFTPVDTVGVGHSPMLGGAARSTLDDYCRFLSMISANGVFCGKRILSPAAIAQMQANQIGSAAVDVPTFPSGTHGAKHTGIYGLGEWRELVDDDGDAILISSPSWAGAYPWIDRKRSLHGFFIAHVDMNSGSAAKDKFQAMSESAKLPAMVSAALAGHEPKLPERPQYPW